MKVIRSTGLSLRLALPGLVVHLIDGGHKNTKDCAEICEILGILAFLLGLPSTTHTIVCRMACP